jgi:hypothetical protein
MGGGRGGGERPEANQKPATLAGEVNTCPTDTTESVPHATESVSQPQHQFTATTSTPDERPGRVSVSVLPPHLLCKAYLPVIGVRSFLHGASAFCGYTFDDVPTYVCLFIDLILTISTPCIMSVAHARLYGPTLESLSSVLVCVMR